MSDTTDNTTELDSYGVWVKRPGVSEEPISEDTDTMFDIPDFPETESSDADFSFDEITADSIPTDTEVSVDTIDEMPEIISDSISEVSLEAFEDTPVTESIPEETPSFESEEPVSTDFELPEEDGEISLDEFMDEGFSDESVASGNNGFAPNEGPAAAVTEEISMDEFSDGEISLDDFLDGGDFTSGPAPEVKPQEEIVDEKPLEMDITFDQSMDTIETEDNILEEEEFDDEPDYIENTNETVHDNASHSTEVFGDTEEIDLSDFGIDANAEETPITQNVEESKMKDKVVDYNLCVSDERMTAAPVVEEVKDAPEPSEEVETPKEPIMTEMKTEAASVAVTNESTELLQQIINELSGMKAEINNLKANLEQIQNQKVEPIVSTSEPETEIENVPEEDSSGFFDSTDGDDTIALSGDELENMLSGVEITEDTEIPEETVTEEPVVEDSIPEESVIEDTIIEEPVVEETVTEEPVIEDTIIEEPVIEDTIIEEPVTEEPIIEETVVEDSIPEESTGFFDDTDSDDTIALSGDELDNMLSGVEISEEAEISLEEPEIEEASIEMPEEEIIVEEIDDIPEEIDIEPVSTEPEPETTKELNDSDTVDDNIFGSVEESDIFIPEEESTDFAEETSIPESEEVMEEPNLEDFSDIAIDEETEDEELPEEISIPKDGDIDSILVESSNDDFMDSVKDTTIEEPVSDPVIEEEISDIEAEEPVVEEEIEKVDDFDEFMSDSVMEESITESHIDYLSEDQDNDLIETSEGFPSVEDSFETEINIEEPVSDEVISEEPVLDETITEEFQSEESTIEEAEIPEETVIEETEEPIIEGTAVTDTEVSENIDEVEETEETPEEDGLKKDIKSVLLYMDQLLENLPEEKIVEFAKSEEFTTYKKLFSELGLA